MITLLQVFFLNFFNHWKSIGILVASLLLSPNLYAEATSHSYLIGRGISDITGPIYGMQMWGFGREDQITEGIHIRQRSRAFVIAQGDEPSKRLVFVSADLGSIEHHITLSVIDRLQESYGDTYTLKNVILSATHTHAGPGGYWHSRSDLGLDGGFYPAHFAAIVDGITASIVSAHEDLQPGNIYFGKGNIKNAGANRSIAAYIENPEVERNRYSRDVPTEMSLMKFVDDSGDIGMINWYALHPTAMNYYNRLISGDHKGYASLKMEQLRGSSHEDEHDFVAAFAQSDPGDVTPNTNLDNTGPGATDVETTQIMGDRQLEMAIKLFDNATEVLVGAIETRQIYIDLSDYEVGNQFTANGSKQTCPSAYGYSFAGGSTEDGGGHFLFEEGMTKQSVFLDFLIGLLTGAPKWTEAVRSCHAPKPILFETGSGKNPLQSQIRSITIARIGQLVILAMPTEITTMSGRRLRASVMDELGSWAQHIILAGYSNGYAGYITTPEEYSVQQYEGGHTLHGQWTLPAYQQIASHLASALQTGDHVNSAVKYDDWRGKSPEFDLNVDAINELPKGIEYGQPTELKQVEYRRGDLFKAKFWSSNPSTHYINGNNYMTIELKTDEGWDLIATDSNWDTTVRWSELNNSSIATLTWDIPDKAATGVYRVRHQGFTSEGTPFAGSYQHIAVK